MYTHCLRCTRSLGTNGELTALRVGRRLAFDTAKGRLWVICRECGQWNLVPLEERWEAIEECDRLAAAAEVRGGEETIGLARTATGLELLRIGGLKDADIANWRYGKRLGLRRSILAWTAMAAGVFAMTLGAGAGMVSGSLLAGGYVAAISAVWVGYMLRKAPRGWLRAPAGGHRMVTVWPWELQNIRIEKPKGDHRPVIVVPQRGPPLRLTGIDAARFLAAALPKLSALDALTVSVKEVLNRVADAEQNLSREHKAQDRKRRRRGGRKRSSEKRPLRPWEHIASRHASGTPLLGLSPANRLALEMAATEELERLALEAEARAVKPEWHNEEEIAGIADGLALPQGIVERVDSLKYRSEEAADAESPASSPRSWKRKR